jgi:citronellol/citronellal dehydrogenase
MAVKRFDLIQSINSRGTFVCSKYAIPHLRKSKNPHILTLSPPLYGGNDPNINWFARLGTGYVLGKYGMTLITHGLSAELRADGIACNTLWPRTFIATAAVENIVGGKEGMKASRKPEIMGDAAHTILTSQSRLTTDNFFIDDEVLISNGMTLGDIDRLYKNDQSIPNHMLF